MGVEGEAVKVCCCLCCGDIVSLLSVGVEDIEGVPKGAGELEENEELVELEVGGVAIVEGESLVEDIFAVGLLNVPLFSLSLSRSFFRWNVDGGNSKDNLCDLN